MTEERPGDQQWVSDPRYELNELRRPQFTPLKKGGVDPAEVEAYVTRLEKLAKSFATFTRELESRISHAKAESRDARDAERRTVDEAMLAAFEAKERILLQAEEKAWEIEEEARRRAAAIRESLGAVEASDEEQVRLREQLGVYTQKVEDLEIQLERWQDRAARLEVDAQRNLAVVADSSDRRREAEQAAAHANELLSAAERRAQALLAAARAEAAQIAADAEANAEQLRRQLSVLEEEAPTGPEVDVEAEAAQAVAAAEAAQIRADAVAEAERVRGEAAQILADAEAEAERVRTDSDTEAAGLRDAAAETAAAAVADSVAQADGMKAEAEALLAEAQRRLVEAKDRIAAAEAEVDALRREKGAEADALRAEAEAVLAEAQRRLAEADDYAATAKDQVVEPPPSTAATDAEAEAARILGEASEAADQMRRDAEALMSAARSAHQRLEKRSSELMAAAERANAEATARRDEAETIRRRAETEAAQMLAEASAILEHARTAPPIPPPATADLPDNGATHEGDPRPHADPHGEADDPAHANAVPAHPADETVVADESRRSRYSRQSAQLPSMGEHAGDVLAAMTDLRRRLSRREDE